MGGACVRGLAARPLERYYLLAGAGDPVRIGLPRGGYVPVLQRAAPPEKAASERDAGRPPAPVDDWPTVVASVFDPVTPDPELTARLVDGRTGNQVWAEKHESRSATPQAFQQETARVIAARVASEQGAVAQLLWAERRVEVAELLAQKPDFPR